VELGVIETLQADGYAVVEGLFREDDIAEIDAVTGRLIESWRAGHIVDDDYRAYQHPEAPSPVLYRIHNLEKKDTCVESLIHVSSFARLVHSVLGEGAIPTAFALILKMPHHGGKVPYHCDPLDVSPGTVYNFSIFLEESDRENGCFEAVPGSHLLPRKLEMSDERPEGAIFVSARRGDVLIHDVRILHGSELSRSERLRRSICIEFQPPYVIDKIGQ
jgi:hypothetical protein